MIGGGPITRSLRFNNVIDKNMFRYYNSSDTQPIAVVAAILRLSRKYQIDYLRDDSVSRLKNMFPSTLDAAVRRYDGTGVKVSPDHIIDTINLAKETGIRSILPFAFFSMMCLNTEVILKGVRRSDGTVAVLSRTDQEIVLLAKDPFRLAQEHDPFRWLDGAKAPSRDCSTPYVCAKVKDECMIYLWRSPFPAPILPRWETLTWTKRLCVSCRVIGEKCYEEGRQLIWNKLPSFFGLPDWAELLK
jgi:hypothetical protein